MARKDSRGRNLRLGESQRKDGKYQYRYTDKWGKRRTIYSWKLIPSDKVPTGKRDDLSLREKEENEQKNLLLGLSTTGKDVTLNELFDSYIVQKRYKGKKLSENTLMNYKSMWEKKIRHSILGNMKVADIRKSDIVSFYYELQENNISYGTITFYQKVIGAVLNWALDDNLILKNPTHKALNEIEGKQKKKEALTIEQQEELLIFAKTYNRNMYWKLIFLLDTMCRISEFAGITWKEIDMKKHLVTVGHQLLFRKYKHDNQTTYHIEPTKNRSVRKIPMTNRLYEVMKEVQTYYFIQKKDYVVDGKTNFVFYSSTGKLINSGNFHYELDKLLKEYNKTAKHKIGSLPPHVLRHTGCTRNAEQGMDMKVLQYLMGHSNLKVTNEVYNHVNSERAEREMLKLKSRESSYTAEY